MECVLGFKMHKCTFTAGALHETLWFLGDKRGRKEEGKEEGGREVKGDKERGRETKKMKGKKLVRTGAEGADQCLNCRGVRGVKPPNCFSNFSNTLSDYVLGVIYILYTYSLCHKFGQAPTVEKFNPPS